MSAAPDLAEAGTLACSTCAESRDHIAAIIAALDDPAQRAMESTWLRHWWSEVLYDLEGVMATVTDDVAYSIHNPPAFGPDVSFSSAAVTREKYAGMFAAGLMPGGPLDAMRMAFAPWGLMFEAVATVAVPGAQLHMPDRAIRDDLVYLVQTPMAGIMPFDRATGLMAGETVHMGNPIAIAPTDAAEIARLLGR